MTSTRSFFAACALVGAWTFGVQASVSSAGDQKAVAMAAAKDARLAAEAAEHASREALSEAAKDSAHRSPESLYEAVHRLQAAAQKSADEADRALQLSDEANLEFAQRACRSAHVAAGAAQQAAQIAHAIITAPIAQDKKVAAAMNADVTAALLRANDAVRELLMDTDESLDALRNEP